jgi:hypothetical protein
MNPDWVRARLLEALGHLSRADALERAEQRGEAWRLRQSAKQVLASLATALDLELESPAQASREVRT